MSRCRRPPAAARLRATSGALAAALGPVAIRAAVTVSAVFALIVFSPGYALRAPGTGSGENAAEALYACGSPIVSEAIPEVARVYVTCMARLARADLGAFGGEPLWRRLAQGSARTVALIVAALVLGLLLGTTAGLLLERQEGTAIGAGLRGGLPIVSLVPVFALAYLTQPLAGPAAEAASSSAGLLGLATGIGVAAAACLALGDGTLAEIARVTALHAARIRNAPFMRTERALGGRVARHFGRNLAVPLLDLWANRFLFLLSGAIVAESIFDLHGLGWLLYEAFRYRDLLPALGAAAATVGIVELNRALVGLVRNRIEPRRPERRRDVLR
ncbi:MAG: ABC transporter permease subunit [Candidatus Schekmanbacteria bacterium]|nr:ABC transporter permease subunit [Candidatus Schekmanbacteria bacterium]